MSYPYKKSKYYGKDEIGFEIYCNFAVSNLITKKYYI